MKNQLDALLPKLPAGYLIAKSCGRVGYQWTCPKGFTHYNFRYAEDAYQDLMAYATACTVKG